MPSTVIFKHIGKRELRNARRWLQEGCRVLYINADPSVNQDGFEALPETHGVESSSMIGLAEAIYQVRLEGSTHLAWARRQFDSEDIRYAFLRSIMSKLFEFFNLMDRIRQATSHQDKTIYLLTEKFWRRSSWDSFIFEFLNLVRSGQLNEREVNKIPVQLQEAMDRIRIDRVPRLKLFFLDLIIPTVFLLRRLQFSAHLREHVHLVIRTYPTDWGALETEGEFRLRNVDFVVDGVSFHTANTIFWAESGVPDDRIRALEKRGYRVVSDSSLRFDPAFIFRIGLPALKAYMTYRIATGIKGSFESLICRELFRTYLRNRAFAEYFTPRYFLLYNDRSDHSVGRTIVLRSTGCKSVFYAHSIQVLIERVAPEIAYLLYDAVVTWGQAMTAYFQKPPGNFGEIWEIGCIWSEHARLVKEDSRLREMYRTRIEAYGGQPLTCYTRTIGVFDTTVNPVLFNLEDFTCFMSDIAWLASEFPDVCMLYKPKYNVNDMTNRWRKEFQEILEQFRKIRNIVVLPSFFETSVAVGLADLTISACFTSTAIESVGCGIKALYYDVSDRCPLDDDFKALNAFWNRISHLICRNREQLSARVYELLYTTSDDEYRDYLRQHFSHVEGYFDGLALTRLRQRLLGVMDEQQVVAGPHG